MTNQKWTDERTATLTQLVGTETPVSVDTIKSAATALEVTDRSIAAKLRKLGYAVTSMAKNSEHKFTDEEATNLQEYVVANSGNLTYGNIAENFMGGKFTSKQIQGKVLSMELTSHIKPTEKPEVERKYSESEEVTFIAMCKDGAFVEDIAAALNKTVNSVRGKAISLLRSGTISKIPSIKESHAKVEVDVIAELGDITKLTVADIAAKTGKTERGIKTTLTRRGLVAADYNGAAKKAKNEANKSAE